MSLLEVRALSVVFRTDGRSTPAVTNLDFSIPESGIFGLAGESGCGKSMTALAIMGLLPQNAVAEGTIAYRGRDLLTLDKESKRKLRGREISMIFQEPMTSLNPVLTTGYQIAEVLTTHLNISRREAMERSVELLRAVRIPSPEIRGREYPHQMSGGMRQRVMIAMAIACNPSLIIADEPTTALDVTIQAQILELIQTLREERKMSILLITHDLGIIAENASAVGIMYAGRLMEHAEARELFSNPRHPYTIGLLESIPQGRGLRLNPIPGTVPRMDALPQGCVYSDRCRYVIPECRREEPCMLQVGPGHTSRCIRAEEIRWNS
ncbi:MAG: ABC transporter ATP-binding protein [Nitrospiraceae bacterium]|nr:ABC transporter ATP-binding protein [Nitrospiraceae bacterium]